MNPCLCVFGYCIMHIVCIIKEKRKAGEKNKEERED